MEDNCRTIGQSMVFRGIPDFLFSKAWSDHSTAHELRFNSGNSQLVLFRPSFNFATANNDVSSEISQNTLFRKGSDKHTDTRSIRRAFSFVRRLSRATTVDTQMDLI
ncbi:hypothetical protein BSLG_004126 [Batrachochytrium salamandrivorans]|nr:hypothetical protein BSLG_004126 [Batrachochytrium salamandrivorans]